MFKILNKLLGRPSECNKLKYMLFPEYEGKRSEVKRKWFQQWRSPENGIEHLKWAAALTLDDFKDDNDPTRGEPSPQALAARETLALYNWWVNERPKRGDTWETSGFQAVWDQLKEKYGKNFPLGTQMEAADEELYNRAHLAEHDLEAAYEAEDTEMMVRLVKLRRSLWT